MSLSLEITVFNKLFAGVAEEMGIVLRRSAFSPNIRERRDYSAAIFTAQGKLLAQSLPQAIPAASQGTMNNLAFGDWGKMLNREE